MQRRGVPLETDLVRETITDIAGVRVVCSFISDVYRVFELLTSHSDVTVYQVKDYIANPKPNGYRSLHLLLEVPVFLSSGPVQTIVEVQLRTIAMDFWASLEHKIYYKYRREVPPELLIPEVAAFIDEDNVARRLRLAGDLAGRAGDSERDLANLERIGTSGYVAEAVAAACYCFVTHPDDFTAAVLTAVNAGGDADTVAAMTGALAGAYLGAAAIPGDLVDGLEGRMYLLVSAPSLYRVAQRRAGLFLQLLERR